MSDWYRKVANTDEADFEATLVAVAEALAHFEGEVDEGLKELQPSGRLWNIAKAIPGTMAYRYTQLQELEATLELLEQRATKKQSEHKRRYLEHYARTLSDRTAGEFAAAEDEVCNLRALINEVALTRNKFLGLTKGLESLHYQIGHLVKMREAGIEDATI